MGGVASFNGVCNVWAPPPNNSVKRTAFRGRLLRALGGRCRHFQFKGVGRSMQCNARTNITVAWGGAGAFVVAKLPGNLIVYSFGKRLRRRRSRKSVASANLTVSVGHIAFATFSAGASLRWAPRPASRHRRLTTRSSGRRSTAFVSPNVAAGAAYLGR